MKRSASLILTVVFLSMVFGLAGFTFADEIKNSQPPAEQPAEEKNVDEEADETIIDAGKEPTDEEIEMERRRKQGLEDAKKVVAAKVNDAPVTMYAVIMMMNRIGYKEDVQAVKDEALNKLIIQELAYQKAITDGLKIEEDNIDKAISNFTENLGGEEAFKSFLDKENLTEEELREQARRSLTIEAILFKEVQEKIKVQEDDLKQEYEHMKDRLIFPEKVSVVDVYFLKSDQAAMKNAQAILKKIKADKDKDPWKLVLDGTFIVRYMELKKDKHKEVYEEAKKLKVGQLSDIIKAPESLHIIKLENYSSEKQATLDDVREWLEEKLKAPALQKRLLEWEEELKKDAKIEIIGAEEAEKK